MGRAADRAFLAVIGGAFITLALGGFAWLFFASAPVAEVTALYWGLHLDAVMALDDLFALCHLLVYAVLALTLAWRYPSAAGWMSILVGLAALGFGVECVQGLGAGRTFSLDDVLANLCGIVLGLLAALLAAPPSARRR